ncbi:uncharacterized protein EDB91DRAFT_892290 [Suillus paluster]|uniref:uncharacterized protein n=1 Tax=Suillus paluster TaxID=48578 RepID=UPI001B86D0F4|nr:uncharacterized protein EDB91DRAFT_892290 [Suillus paluster]KAG1727486.1 hypothetical protein EDB91DRAFT_892290 [Suillus paluster]
MELSACILSSEASNTEKPSGCLYVRGGSRLGDEVTAPVSCNSAYKTCHGLTSCKLTSSMMFSSRFVILALLSFLAGTNATQCAKCSDTLDYNGSALKLTSSTVYPEGLTACVCVTLASSSNKVSTDEPAGTTLPTTSSCFASIWLPGYWRAGIRRVQNRQARVGMGADCNGEGLGMRSNARLQTAEWQN